MIQIPRAPYIKSALFALLISFVLVVSAAVRAIRIPPVEVAPTTTSAASLRSTSLPPVPDVDVQAVGENDIFAPDRNAMPQRYRMPGDPGPAAAAPPAPPEPPKPIVLGTVIVTDGTHFATCQLPGGRPTIVHVGDRLGEYTVVGIERNKVSFRTPKNTTIDIAAIRPGG